MNEQTRNRPHRVLIVSANPLFREGLYKFYMHRWGSKAELVGLPSTMEGALEALTLQQPDLVIVDYDDKTITRDEFLNRFVIGESPLKVVLVSLDAAGQVVVFDRKRLTSSQAEDWLNDPWPEDFLPE
ncbi:MAG: hypothetical protein AB1846_10815 [Chloroflexota bacterium]